MLTAPTGTQPERRQHLPPYSGTIEGRQQAPTQQQPDSDMIEFNSSSSRKPATPTHRPTPLGVAPSTKKDSTRSSSTLWDANVTPRGQEAGGVLRPRVWPRHQTQLRECAALGGRAQFSGAL